MTENKYISVKSYTHLTGLSERTIRRYIANHDIDFLVGKDKRVMIAMTELKNNSVIAFNTDVLDLIKQADTGEAAAQNDVALLFLDSQHADMAFYWLNIAAKQHCSDAMQLLGECYVKGLGVKKDRNQAISWLAKAATAGSQIASQQMDGILLNRH